MLFALLGIGAFIGSLAAGGLVRLFSGFLNVPLSDPKPYRYSLLIAGVFLFLGVLCLLRVREVKSKTTKKEVPGGGPKFVKIIIVMALITLLGVVGFGAVRTYFNVYMDVVLSVSASQIAVVMALSQLLILPAALSMPLIVEHFGKRATVLIAYALNALCLLPLALISHWFAASLGFVAFMLFTALSQPAFSLYTQESVTPGWRPIMSGARMTAVGLGMAAAAFGGGYVIAATSYRTLFLLGVLIPLLATALFAVHARGQSEQVVHENPSE
jgi:predicted MFS family arabinose efflux permease